MKHKTHRIWIFFLISVCLLVLLPVVGCSFVPLNILSPIPAPDSFPNTEITYTVYVGREVGFVNSDGSNKTMISLKMPESYVSSSLENPIFTADGRMVFVVDTIIPGFQGEVIAVPAGQIPIQCGWRGVIEFTPDGSHILVNTGTEIDKYLLADCGTVNPSEIVYGAVGSFFDVLSPDERYIAKVKGGEMGIEEHIVILNLETGEERNLGNGTFPVWSRDGKWLAFTGTDGIYIVQNNSDSQPSRLVALENVGPNVGAPVYQEDRFRGYYPPIVSWSPDGQWLVYHACLKLVQTEAGWWDGQYSIFKVNVETGETIKLLDGGYSPSWRWPAQP